MIVPGASRVRTFPFITLLLPIFAHSSCLAGSIPEQLPHDVCLSFPQVNKGQAELWARSDMLSESSSYSKALFSSEFAETVPCCSKRSPPEHAPNADTAPVEKDSEDSDDDTDEFILSIRPSRSEELSVDLPAKPLVITQSAYSTYSALLVYLQSDFIEFCPLTSSFPSSSHPTRSTFITTKHTTEPSLPLPVSPKSMYRLADLLDLPGVKRLSLEAFRSSLSLKNAAQAFFSDTSLAYDELHGVILDFIKANCSEVKAGGAWKEKMREIEAGELPEGAPVVVKLLSWL
ncbi:hypothetical protein JCM8547_004620 [Rhodosporidiobolus lusitaniae]